MHQAKQLSTRRALHNCRNGVQLSRQLAQQPALAGLISEEYWPGKDAANNSEVNHYIQGSLHSGVPSWACLLAGLWPLLQERAALACANVAATNDTARPRFQQLARTRQVTR